MSLQESISSNLKETLTKMGKKQAWLAKETGIKPQNISAYIRGVSVPDLSTICIIAGKLGVSVDWLCGRSIESDGYQKVKTLGDIAREILYMYDMMDVFVSSVKKTESWCVNYDQGDYPEFKEIEREYQAIAFYDKDMCSFIEDWQKIKSLRNANTIDEELYQLWLDKHISDLDKIQVTRSFPNFADTDAGVPF